ncbi:DUF4393 domain-containing protein [Streptococcus gordonii]|uniref:DUF4393 domain-containing protein n=1 Tax=Streptococcus gordonii TaxID=1302 RepID=UPI002283B2DC|nr:DUF4393 domain-containing protein [Streptococcus gordonii]MCY7147342.1 DUF4393 domain-containing protein [Streptococcus gordonii]
MDLNQFQDFLPLVTGFLGGATSAGVFAGPIQTLQDWWYINYGHGVSNQAALLRAKNEIDVENLRNSTLQEVATIPPENIQEPPLKILGPALEASKYYIEEEELRSMFAKILSSSFDNRKNSVIHPSFVEIIKQLDVTDARILQSLKEHDYAIDSPIPCMKAVVKSDEGTKMIFPIIYFIDGSEGLDQLAPSLTNLERLGLVRIKSDIYSANDSDYDFIRNNIFVQHVLGNHPEISVEKMCFSITPLGKNFLEVCL